MPDCCVKIDSILSKGNGLSLNWHNCDMTMEEEKKIKKRKPRIKCNYRVQLYEDGKYHWMYDLHLLKNPSVLIDVYKMLGITMVIFFFILFVIHSCSEGLNVETFGTVINIVAVIAAIFFVLGLLGYLLYAAISGWVYTVHFILDEKGVVHKQSPKAKKVAKRIGFLTMMAGLLSRRPSVMGSGALAASRTSMSSDFSVVRKVKALRRINTIKVNEPFGKNRVYVCNEDFDFVYDYICSHCPKAKIL